MESHSAYPLHDRIPSTDSTLRLPLPVFRRTLVQVHRPFCLSFLLRFDTRFVRNSPVCQSVSTVRGRAGRGWDGESPVDGRRHVGWTGQGRHVPGQIAGTSQSTRSDLPSLTRSGRPDTFRTDQYSRFSKDLPTERVYSLLDGGSSLRIRFFHPSPPPVSTTPTRYPDSVGNTPRLSGSDTEGVCLYLSRISCGLRSGVPDPHGVSRGVRSNFRRPLRR